MSTSEAQLIQIVESAYIADTARLFGKITIGEGSSVWFGAVMRAECDEIVIGHNTNIQDQCVVHVGFGKPTVIGDYCSVTHHATIHGATIGDNCLVGIGAVVMDGAVIGENSIVAGNAFVPEGREFPPNSLIAGTPAKLVKEIDARLANRTNAWVYAENAQGYRQGDHRVWSSEAFLGKVEQAYTDLAR